MKGGIIWGAALVCAPLGGVMAAPDLAPAVTPVIMPVITGGWQQADAAEATKAARFALPHLKDKHPRLRRILTAEQQIVAGVNYRLTLLLRNGHRWRVTVWRKLDGGMEVTEMVRVGSV